MAHYRIHSVKIYTDAMGAAVTLADVLSQDHQLEPELRAEVTAGNVSPTFVSLVARKPKFSFSTYAIAQALDTFGVTGIGVHAATNPGVVAYFQKINDDGIAESSGHRSLTYGLGVLIPKTLSCDHQGDYRLALDLIVLGDGTNAPVTISDSATLPTISQAAARWTLGPVSVNGTQMRKYSSVEIDFGNEAQVRGSQSLLDPTHVEQKTHSPKITITGIDPTWFSASNIPVGGRAVANATDYVMLRKRSQDGDSFVADGTAEHIKISIAGLAAIGQIGRAEMQRTTETTLVIAAAKDASGNAPFVLDTTSAIA